MPIFLIKVNPNDNNINYPGHNTEKKYRDDEGWEKLAKACLTAQYLPQFLIIEHQLFLLFFQQFLFLFLFMLFLLF